MFRLLKPQKVLSVVLHLSMMALIADVLEVIEPGTQYRSYKGHQLLRVHPIETEDVEKLVSLERDESKGIDFWRRPSTSKRNVDLLVGPENERQVKEILNKIGLQTIVVSDDVQKLIDEELIQRSNTRSWSKRSIEFNRLHKYQSFSSMMEWMDGVKVKCSYCQVLNIGKSSEGRDLKVMKISKSSQRKPAIFIDGGFHAREWIAPVTALNFIDALTNVSDPVTSFLTREYDWYILPLANPDGYVYSWTKDGKDWKYFFYFHLMIAIAGIFAFPDRLWRKTRSKNNGSDCIGTDLNRNWDFFWGGEGTSRNSCRENFCGQRPFSEPESRSIAKFIMHRADDLTIYLSLHSYGQLILAPWGHTTRVPHDFYDLLIRGTEAAEAMRKTTGAKYSVGSTGRTLYLASGASDDWVKGVAKVKYSFTIELRDMGNRGFLLPESEIPDTSLEATNGIIKMSLDVLQELRRFGNKNSVVFKENVMPDNEEDAMLAATPIKESLQELQDKRNEKYEEILVDKEHIPDGTLEKELQFEDGLESYLKGKEISIENQKNKKLVDLMDETIKQQRLKHHFIMKHFRQEIMKQNSKYKVNPGNLISNILKLLNGRIQSNKRALF